MASYFRGVGYVNLECCGDETNCELCNSRWYPKCEPGYIVSGCNRCVKQRAPVIDESGITIWTWIFVIITLVLLFIFLYRLFTIPTITPDTVPDLILGEPGVSDPYAVLDKLSTGPYPEYYI